MVCNFIILEFVALDRAHDWQPKNEGHFENCPPEGTVFLGEVTTLRYYCTPITND